METQKNQNWLIHELQSELKILKEILTNQATIIGHKDVMLYRYQERIDELEAEKQEQKHRAKSLFWSIDRNN